MSNEKTTLEIIAPTVDEAIEKGATQLGLSRDQIEIEVLDEGNRGLFGIGSRQARVRLSLKAAPTAAPETGEDFLEEEDNELPVQGNDIVLDSAVVVVRTLLEKMRVHARVSARYIPAEDPKEKPVVLVDVQGNDLSILIGRRSETLNALQYVTNLILSKEVGGWVPLMIDVQGYRARRERQLRKMARRLAEQVVHTDRRQMLEPMPANERRIIHLELRDNALVTTESVGEEPYRKVTIVPKH
jgi:spoIIIJ-associated protein